MTKAKSSQARASKRNARAKAKKISANKARTAPSELRKKNFRSLLSGDRLEFDQVLGNVVRDINHRKQTEATFESIQDVLAGLKQNTTEVFKLYSYITLLNALIKEKLINFTLVVDLKAISIDLISIDKRIQTMAKLVDADEEEAVLTEALDISNTLQNYAEELFAEVSRSETHALVIEEYISRLADEITGVDDVNQRRYQVLERIAYIYLGEVKEEIDRQNNTAPATETAEAVTE
jgi:hypothetical protein